jgi:hypothetical protein
MLQRSKIRTFEKFEIRKNITFKVGIIICRKLRHGLKNTTYFSRSYLSSYQKYFQFNSFGCGVKQMQIIIHVKKPCMDLCGLSRNAL